MGNKIIQGQLEISGNLLVNGEEAATKDYVQHIASSGKELITIDENWVDLEETERQQDEWNSWVILTIPEEYRDVEKLKNADLTDGNVVFQLNTEVEGSFQYQYIRTWNEAPEGTAVSFQYIWLHTNNWSGVMSGVDLPAAVARMEINNGEPTTETLSSLYFGGTNYAVSSGEGTTVTPNPTLSGSETVLTGIAIDGTNYKIPSGGSGDGTTVEANPTDDATDVLAKLKVAGVTYSLPSGGSSEGGSLEPIIKEVIEGEDGVYFTLTEDELARIANNLGTVVNLDLGGVYLPLTPTYFTMSMTTMQAQFIFCAEIVELNGWYRFEPTAEDPLTFAWNQADMSNPYGGDSGATSGSNSAPYVLHDYNAMEWSQFSGSLHTILPTLTGTISGVDYRDCLNNNRPLILTSHVDAHPDDNIELIAWFVPASHPYSYSNERICEWNCIIGQKLYILTFSGNKYYDDDMTWSITKKDLNPIYTYTEDLTSVNDFNNVINNNYTHVYLKDTGYECPWIIVSKSDTSYICELTTGFMSPASTNTNGYDGACKTYIRFNYDSESNAVTYNYYNVYTSTVMGNPDADHTNDVTEVSEPLETILINDKLYSVGGSAGTVVEANPTLSGSEVDLTSIAIDGTNYKLSSGESNMSIVPITETLDNGVVTITETRFNELMNATHISYNTDPTTIICNAVLQTDTTKTFSALLAGDGFGALTFVISYDAENNMYTLTGEELELLYAPTNLVAGNLPVATADKTIEDSGIVAENIVTTDVLQNKITFIVNEDNTLDLIIN